MSNIIIEFFASERKNHDFNYIFRLAYGICVGQNFAHACLENQITNNNNEKRLKLYVVCTIYKVLSHLRFLYDI